MDLIKMVITHMDLIKMDRINMVIKKNQVKV